jgi:adenylate cyclase
MPSVFGRLYRRLGTKYFALYVVFEFVSASIVCLATVGIFRLYTEASPGEFWRVVAVADAAVTLAVAYAVVREWKLARPIIDWILAGRPADDALSVWRCAVAMPRQLVLANGWRAFAIVAVPVAIYATLEFDLPAHSALIIFAGTMVAVAYAAILHFFAAELFLRPVLEDIASRLPPDFSGSRVGVPLRWKLLGALPLINVITGVVASGRSTDGRASLDDLGLDVVVAVGVALTISWRSGCSRRASCWRARSAR